MLSEPHYNTFFTNDIPFLIILRKEKFTLWKHQFTLLEHICLVIYSQILWRKFCWTASLFKLVFITWPKFLTFEICSILLCISPKKHCHCLVLCDNYRNNVISRNNSLTLGILMARKCVRNNVQRHKNCCVYKWKIWLC